MRTEDLLKKWLISSPSLCSGHQLIVDEMERIFFLVSNQTASLKVGKIDFISFLFDL